MYSERGVRWRIWGKRTMSSGCSKAVTREGAEERRFHPTAEILHDSFRDCIVSNRNDRKLRTCNDVTQREVK